MDAIPKAQQLVEDRTVRRKRLNVQRVLRHRARRRKQTLIFQIEVSREDRDGFVQLGVLSPEQHGDRAAVRHAIALLCQLGCKYWPDAEQA